MPISGPRPLNDQPTSMRTNTLILAACLAVLSACSSNEVLRGPVDVTVGQQLIDLKNAHDSGALMKSEYDEQRRKLIDSIR